MAKLVWAVGKYLMMLVLANFVVLGNGMAVAADSVSEAASSPESNDKLLGLSISLPVLGPDAFEPDNTPQLAVWSGLQKLLTGVIGALLPTPDIHNLHVAEDEDWSKFEATQGIDVTVETLNVGRLADTHLTVYRLLAAGEPLPTKVPAGSDVAWITGPNGELLAVIGVNDDSGEAGAQGIRSVLKFNAPKSGLYYSRVKFSPKAGLAKALDSSGDTTYSYQATSKSTMTSTLYCTLLDSKSGQAVTTGTLTFKPSGAKVTKNSKGVYTISGLQSGSYTVTASATGYTTVSATVYVGSGATSSATIRIAPALKSDESEVTQESAASFDYAAPYGQVSLDELLRLVQLYNAKNFHCDEAGDDAFALYRGNLQCAPHGLDSSVQDWTIDLSELLRGVQIYTLGGYRVCPDSSDGICAGKN